MLANLKRESAAAQMRTSVMPEASTARVAFKLSLTLSGTISHIDEVPTAM